MSRSKDSVIDAVGTGARTHRIAARLGWPTAKARRALGKLEREGMVERHAHYTAANDIYWLRSTKWQHRLQPDPHGCPYLGTSKPCPLCKCGRKRPGRLVDSALVARMIERAEIAPIIKQRLVSDLADLARDSDGNPEGGDGTAPSRSDDSAGQRHRP